MFVVKDAVREPLFAIVPYHNVWRSKAREKHTTRAIKHFIDSGAVVILVEVGFNRRELAFADSGIDGLLANCNVIGSDHNFRHMYIGLHSSSELWLKENMINVGGQHAVLRYGNAVQNISWQDSDVMFLRPNWVGETIHKLQHGSEHDIAFLQMFSHARDLGPNYEMLDESYPHANGISFVDAWQRGFLESSDEKGDAKTIRKDGGAMVMEGHAPDGYYGTAGPHRVFPGLAWACTRKAWDAVGGLLDIAIWGGGDWHMAHALIEKTEMMMRNDLHPNYKKIVNQWYQRCRTQVRRNVLQMEGTIVHNWHGRKAVRGYNVKHGLLSKFGFDPPRHLKRDAYGLYMLNDDRSSAFVQIRDMMRRVARERNEDSIDV